MLNLWGAKRIVIVGGGIDGWLAALEMRRLFGQNTEVLVLESKAIDILEANEGSLPNFDAALQRYAIERDQFMHGTNATFKVGTRFDNWRTGQQNEHYYHLFSPHMAHTSLEDMNLHGFYPMASVLVNKQITLEQFMDGYRFIQNNASQQEIADYLSKNPKANIAYHFDSQCLASYLRERAQERGVKHMDTVVEDAVCHENGHIAYLKTDVGKIVGDFFIDASGFKRLLSVKKLNINWIAYSQHLLNDSVLSFLMPSDHIQPHLYTQAKALKNGWMWAIPTLNRLGCGYVYSSAHTNETEVIRELFYTWGREIEPIDQFKFTSGRLQHCWQGNVMAIGRASGFIEPLEASSIGQTLNQLAAFGDLIGQTSGFISECTINMFNAQIVNCWDGLLDFLLMHYNTKRTDTAFWRDVQQLPETPRYTEIKNILRYRTPRDIDFAHQAVANKNMFGALNWLFIAAAMGLIQPAATINELASLDKDKRNALLKFAEHVKSLTQATT